MMVLDIALAPPPCQFKADNSAKIEILGKIIELNGIICGKQTFFRHSAFWMANGLRNMSTK